MLLHIKLVLQAKLQLELLGSDAILVILLE
jgi:hypothetical protein